MQNKPSRFTRFPVILALAAVSTFLWGSAFPFIKIGSELYSISADDTAAKLLFAGYRFFLAGIMTIVLASILYRKPAIPAVKSLPSIAALGVVQTAVQYFFFYVGLSHTTGVKGSILASSSVFFGVFFAHFAYHDDRLTSRKICGCLLGFAGIILVNFNGSGSLSGGFSPTGEGFMLLAAAAFGVSGIISKAATEKSDSMTVTGYQLLIGGLMLTAAGLLGGARLQFSGAAALSVLLYLALLSSVSFTLWTLLLKHNPVSKISIFNFLTPVFGVILSGILLGESFLSLKTLFSLILVCAGICIVELTMEKAPKKED